MGASQQILATLGGNTGAADLSYLQLQTYTGDGSFPRSFASGYDLSDASIWVKKRAAANQNWSRFFKDGTDWYRHVAGAAAAAVAANFSADSNSWDLASNTGTGGINDNTATYLAWLFRKQTGSLNWTYYTGNGSTQAVAHGLGATPGAYIIKSLGTTDWWYYHRGFNSGSNPEQYAKTVGNSGLTNDSTYWNNTSPDATNIYLGSNANVNTSGQRYLLISFAHDTGPNGVIQCFRYTGNGLSSGPTISLGWQPRMVWINQGSTGNSMFGLDSERSPGFTGNDAIVDMAAISQETSAERISLVSGGFQIVTSSLGWNNNNINFVGWAFR